MAKKRETQIRILEEVRGEQDLSVPEFSAALGISRQWYYDQLKSGRDVLDLQSLSELSVDHVGSWLGDLAVRCIKLIDPRFVPCPCETDKWDHGDCPRHGVVGLDTPQSESARLLDQRVAEVAA